jgi:adenylosuccinate lyase
LRNTGVVFAHMLIAIKSTLRGFGKVKVNGVKLEDDLEKNQAILAEPIQTLMRLRGEKDPYEKLKKMTRGKEITKEDLNALVQSCKKLTTKDKQRMIDLTPATYTGLAKQLVDFYFQENQ